MHREEHVAIPERRAPAHGSYVPRVRPFHIRVEQDVLDDLEMRLGRARSTRATEEPGWKHGTDPAYLRALVHYWRVGYDWRRHEAKLGELPQYIARIGEDDIHFVHLRAKTPSATPLLLAHGWPDSFYRYHRLAPMLVAHGFDVVVPSLPGFAFSPPLSGRGDKPMRAVAKVMHSLMTDVLGYEQYGVVGGDGGSVLAQALAIDFHESVTGIHLTDLGWHATRRDPSTVTWRERRYLARAKKRFLEDGAYVMVQSTRPRSLAVALADSPIGLASWIIDRFHAWSDGDLDARFGKDTLITNVMLYWITRSVASSIFTYYAEAKSPSLEPSDFVDRPVGLALFPHDIAGVPSRKFAERTLAITRWTEMPRGGHFAALEEPELYARDVVAFFHSLEGS
jgi:pimeloyl-ACP methyl ester carboxylesterase